MGDLTFRVKFDLGSTLDITAMVNKAAFPLLHQAVAAVAEQTANDWRKAVYAGKMWSGEKDAYAKSISWKMTGDFTAVVEATYRYAEDIESGRPPRDLKKMLDTSLKVRQSKSGTRYLYIPFRHNTPGSGAHAKDMPPSIHALASKLAPSSIIGQTTRQSGTGAFDTKTKKHLTVRQNVYSWGGRLQAGLSPKLQAHHKTDPHAGMVRFNTSTPGSSKSSQYLTFRTMSDKSKGWIIPAQPGQNIARGVQDRMQPLATAAFQAAIAKTIKKG